MPRFEKQSATEIFITPASRILGVSMIAIVATSIAFIHNFLQYQET